MESRIKEIFGHKGLLHREFPGFEYRASQESLASAIWDRLNSEQGGVISAEAPTGLGKTFAVLLPSILWAMENEKKILFLTASIPLQEQLFYKDIPQISRLLEIDLSYGILKGRKNYACKRKSEGLGLQGFLSFNDQGRTSRMILEWLKTTVTGDISELDIPPDHLAIQTITCPEKGCLGHRCPFRDDCYVQRVIDRSRDWTVAISNFHLYFAYLMGASKPFPYKPDLVVCDEAHKISDAARSVSSISTSADDFRRLFENRNMVNLKSTLVLGEKKLEEMECDFRKCLPTVLDFFTYLENSCRDGVLIKEYNHECWKKGKEAEKRLFELIERLSPFMSDIREPSMCTSTSGLSIEKSTVAAWYEELSSSVSALNWCLGLDRFPAWAYWKEGGSLISKPTICSDSIPGALFSSDPDLVIMISATLRIDHSFAFWENEIGIASDIRIVLDSPFPLEEQMEIWVVETGLRVTDRGYDEKNCRIIERLIEKNHGKTLVLLSSMRLLRKVGDHLKGKNREYPVLIQGDLPRNELLTQFRENIDSVLVGSVSFREGIDVPGESLSQVIIDRIPFPHPNDPQVQARNEFEGAGAFLSVTLPVAKLYLRQAIGRLIRTSSDRGKAVILDGRVLSRRDWSIPSSLPKVKYKKIYVKENSVASKDSV